MATEVGTAQLLIFAKYPRAGGVKTRLVPPLAFEQSAELYRAFLLDAVEQYLSLDRVQPVLCLAGTDAELEAMRRLLDDELSVDSSRLELRLQNGDGLGERLENAVAESFEQGCGRVCVVGSDHPTLPLEYVTQAFDRLNTRSMVIGPADDGGYYLLGMQQLYSWAFAGLPFSSPDLFEQTLRVAVRRGIDPVVLPTWYDVDDQESLERLWAERGRLKKESRTAVVLQNIMNPTVRPSNRPTVDNGGGR